MIYFCDSSAVVKIYLDETGSAFMRDIFHRAPLGNVFVNFIAGPEVLSALHRRFRSGDLPPDVFNQALADFVEDFEGFYNRMPSTEPVIARAMRLISMHPLRGSDSVQLATALHLQHGLRQFNGVEVQFLCSDRDLNSAAANEGLFVVNPSEQQ